MSAEPPLTQVEDLPTDFIRQVLSLLGDRDACAAACACTTLRSLALEGWQHRALSRWAHGWSNPHWQQLQQEAKHLQLYSERHEVDSEALQLLKQTVWPLRREQALQRMLQLGMDCYDALADACGGDGPAGIGHRYRAMHALTQLQVQRCCSELSALMAGPAAADWTAVEQGALLIAQLHYPLCDMSGVVGQLDALGLELNTRLGEAGVKGGRKALEILNHLLFGQRAPEGTAGRGGQGDAGVPAATFTHTYSPAAARPAAAATAAGPPPGSPGSSATGARSPPPAPEGMRPRLLRCTNLDVIGLVQEADAGAGSGASRSSMELPEVPPPGFGLGLRGNREDYANPHNSLLPAVLSTGLGIPISLSTLHMLVGRRVGLPLHLLNMPMHVISCMWHDPALAEPGAAPADPAADPGSTSAAPGSTSDAGGTADAGPAASRGLGGEARAAGGPWECDETLYVDSYNNRILDREQLKDFMSSLGLIFSSAPRYLQPLTPRGACQRMCANLIEIYNRRRGQSQGGVVKGIMQLCCCMSSTPREALSTKSRMLAMLVACNEYDAALGVAAELRGLLQQEQDPSRQLYIRTHLDNFQRQVQEQQADFHTICMRQATRAPGLVLFAVGDVIRHKRYHYRGVVVEWDSMCCATEEWMQQMRVDSLPGGRSQPFYKVLVDVRDRCPVQSSYVAQCNLELMQVVQPQDALISHPEPGRYFDAFDPERCRYVPNAELRFRFPQDGN